MAVSLERAAQCIGRTVRHDNKAVRGVVDHVTAHDVWVKTSDGDVIPCIPAHLSWVSTLSQSLVTTIKNGWNEYDDAQARYSEDIYTDDVEDDNLLGFGILYSPASANDSDRNHPLYIVARQAQRVYPIRFNANPDTAWEIEEVLEWATA